MGRSTETGSHREPSRNGARGSILLVVLFSALITALSIQTLSTVLICATRAALDEKKGRLNLLVEDQGLEVLRQSALLDWQAAPWRPLSTPGSLKLESTQGALLEVPDSGGMALEAMVRQDPEVSALVTSAWVEQGRDGIDLPFAAVVAARVSSSPDRSQPWLSSWSDTSAGGVEGGASEVARAYLVQPDIDTPVGENCLVLPLSEPWQLEEGWRTAIVAVSQGGQKQGSSREGPEVGVVGAEGAFLINGRPGLRVSFPEEALRLEKEPAYFLVILTGGADLDARGLGVVHGVVVVDGGCVLLDGTTLFGAVIATGSLDVGETGTVVFSSSTLRWATDRSLRRVRLVPGSRWEESVSEVL